MKKSKLINQLISQPNTPINTPTQNQFTNCELEQIDKQAVDEMAEIMCDDCLSHFPKCARRVCDAVLQQAEVIYKAGYRKQSEWIGVEDKLPEDVYGKDIKQITVLICTKSGKVRSSSRIKVRMVHFNREMQKLENTDIFEWSEQIPEKVTHWMPLPEPPKMKGGSE